MFREFLPKSFLILRKGYSFALFRKDLTAGVTVAIIALPLAMAFAIASGVTPGQGIFTAIIAGFLISALGGSRYQIGGPVGAFIVILYDIIQRNGYEGLAVSTLIASVILVLMGLFRLGSWIKYIPHPLVVGFTTGLAVIIFSSQIKDFFGLKMGTPPAPFVEKWAAYIHAFPTLHLPTLFLGLATLAVILLIRKFIPRLPWGIGSIAVATLAVYVLDLDVETIQSRFGQIPNSLPRPAFPSFAIPLERWPEIFTDAITIAFLAGIESLLSAVIADGMMGTRHRSNSELVGQGVANFASVLFGGIPASGAIARTAANVKSGAQTPMAGMIHAIVLFLFILCLAPIVSQVPLVALAAVLIMVAWVMAEVGHFIHLLKAPIGDMAVLATTFLLTVFVDITVSVLFGTILACFLFMKRMSDCSKHTSLTKLFQEKSSEAYDPDALEHKSVPSNVEVYEFQGPFFFGVADVLKDVLNNFEKPPKIFILRMRFVPFIDASGMNALKEFYHKCQRSGTTLLLSGVKGQTQLDLSSYGLTTLIGPDHIFPHIDEALSRARYLGEEIEKT
ncbi:MAG: sulfate permease [Verrucomicrobia bacterium]|nr:sulfate permease [Verrucomicrobiota bacterium]